MHVCKRYDMDCVIGLFGFGLDFPEKERGVGGCGCD